MSILVAYASKHGPTEEIAQRIAEGLRAAGQPARARPVLEAGDLDDYEGFVIGSAAYSTHWLKDAAVFVRINRDLLARRPVWLFSNGPLAAEAPEAREAMDLDAPVEPREIRGFQAAIHPRDHRTFFDALGPGRLSSAERSSRNNRAIPAVLTDGAVRDWSPIEEWAEGIAREMAQLDALPLEGTTPCSERMPRTAARRWVQGPVVPFSMRRTRRLNTIGGACVALGLLALLLGSPVALMLAWSGSGTLVVGVAASAMVGGLGLLLLVANWLVLGLGERNPAERERFKRERDDYEAANRDPLWP